MNKRIEELAEQSGFRLVDEECYHLVSFAVIQEFAELIVKECIAVAVHNPSGYVYTAADAGLVSAGRTTAARLIEEHFGVE